MGLSVKFNGYELNQYIDVLIGFTPFSGAEWSPELLGDAGLKRGADFSYTTYKQKQIPMPYTVLEDLGEKHDELARILNVDEPKELVFGNAPDRVFYAVPMGDLDFDDYECLGEGVITWLVPDSLAHSTVEKTDWENYKQNEKLVRLSDLSALPDDPGTNYMHPNHVMGGSLVTETIGGKPYLRLRPTGAVSAGKWIRAMKTLTVPADSEGHAGAKNFYCYLNHWFETGLMGQTAEQSVAFLTGDNKVICGYSLFKSDMTGNTACLEFWLNGKIVRSISFAPSSSDNANPFNNGRGHNDIRKEGDKVTFYWFGNYPSYRSSAIRNMECKKIQVAFTQFDSRGLGNKYVTRNYLRSLEFQKMGVEKWRDVPNRYQEGDVVSIDGEAARVYVNGMANTGDEMIGTKYFHVPPGETKVQFYCSSFCNPAPSALHYYGDELHSYREGSACTCGFKASARHGDAQYLVEGNKLAFRYGGRDYYFNHRRVQFPDACIVTNLP